MLWQEFDDVVFWGWVDLGVVIDIQGCNIVVCSDLVSVFGDWELICEQVYELVVCVLECIDIDVFVVL